MADELADRAPRSDADRAQVALVHGTAARGSLAVWSSLALAIALVFSSGCYQSHGRDAGAAADSSVRACSFSFSDEEAGRVECSIASDSRAACGDAARCICEARLPDGAEDEVASCVAGITLPRALVTLGDFCPFDAPARMNLAEALMEFIPWIGTELRVSEGCAELPALLGPR